jgi:hypothetical protein
MEKLTMLRMLLFAVAVLALAACGSSDEYITVRPDDGAEWPFVERVTAAYVYCDGDAVHVRILGGNYAANGAAKAAHGYPFVYESGLVREGMDGATFALKACGVM